MSLDADFQNHRKASEAVIGFICCLSITANKIFGKIFDEIRACSAAPREKVQTPKLMSQLAFYLGRMFTEIRSLNEPHLKSYCQVGITSPKIR